jgi:DNA-binding MarR family transcriptional regulator
MYELISFVTRAKNRKLVLTNLKEPKTPSGLSADLEIHRSAVSRAILELESKKLVKCLNPQDKMGRYYQITETGKKVLKEI